MLLQSYCFHLVCRVTRCSKDPIGILRRKKSSFEPAFRRTGSPCFLLHHMLTQASSVSASCFFA